MASPGEARRRANTDELNLPAVGIRTGADGLIEVDKYLRTSNSKIYAAGDVSWLKLRA